MKYIVSRMSAIAILLAGLLLALSTVTPTCAYAVEGTDIISQTDVPMDIVNVWGNIGYFGTQMIFNFVKSFVEPTVGLANEFLNTITGNALFTAGIDDSRFSQVMVFVGNVTTALLPIGYLILGVFAGIEALRIVKDTKSLSSQWIGLGVMEAWLVYAIKFTLLYTIVTNAKALMLAIYQVVSMVQVAIQNAIRTSGLGDPSNSFNSLTSIMNQVTFNDVGIMGLIALVAIVALVVSALTAIYIQVLAVMRLFEIFILIAVSPVSLAGLVSNITSSITAGYLKTFVGAVLQISILFLIVAIAGPLLSGVASSINSTFQAGTTGVEMLLGSITPIVTTLALFLMAKQSRPIADRIAGAA